MDKITLEMHAGWPCHFIYEVSGAINGHVEVQFDDGVFNGIILFTADSWDDDEMIWDPLEDKELYEIIKERAIKDYSKEK